MTDPTPDGFADTPGPQATPEQDADIRSLLAFLRDQPLEMPPDVVARIDAVIAEERRTGAAGLGASGATATADDDDDARTLAPVTVLPTHGSRRGPSRRAFAVVGGLAAAALVVIGGVNILGGIGGGASTTSAGASAAPAVGSVTEGSLGGRTGTRVSASGTTYSKAALAAQAQALVTDARKGATTSDASTPTGITVPNAASGESTPAATRSGGTAYGALSATAAAACVSSLTQDDGSVAIAVDSGSYEGKPALVVVVPSREDPTSLNVWVVPPTCSATSSTFFAWESIPAP